MDSTLRALSSFGLSLVLTMGDLTHNSHTEHTRVSWKLRIVPTFLVVACGILHSSLNILVIEYECPELDRVRPSEIDLLSWVCYETIGCPVARTRFAK